MLIVARLQYADERIAKSLFNISVSAQASPAGSSRSTGRAHAFAGQTLG